MKKIAFVTYAARRNLTEDDKYLAAELERRGMLVEPVPWDSADVEWREFDAVILRSTWNYYRAPDAFAKWISKLEALGVNLWNSPDVVFWNMKKTYLRDLERADISIPKTFWFEKQQPVDLAALLKKSGLEKIVVKPVISATAYQTWLVSEENVVEAQEKVNNLIETADVLVQEFIAKINEVGEWSLMFFGGKFSHAVVKRPQENDFRVQSEYGGSASPSEPPEELIAQAHQVLQKVDSPLLYARVDGIFTENVFKLLELELVEPELFFRTDRKAPERFAQVMVENNII